MAGIILGGDFTVYYEAENRQKRVVYTGAGTTYSVNQLYSALADLFDELTQMDDGSVMSAQTPTEYTIGIIDAGDDDPWFIDMESVQYLYGGAIKTANWARVQDSNTGIVRVAYDVGLGTDFAATDIGLTVTHTDGDSGTLLDYVSNGTSGFAWIRPADATLANNWDSTTGTIAVTGGTGSVTQTAAAESGEMLWANIYSIGTIADNTHLYINQNNTLLTGYKSATDWWGDGHIDILVPIVVVGQEIDDGVITVLARRYGASYDYFELDLSSGGRNPIPLATSEDIDNTSGYRRMALTDASASFTVGEIIQDDNDTTIRGVVTSSTGTAPNVTVEYYLVGDPLNDFSSTTGTFTGLTSGSTATAVNPVDVGPAAMTGLSVVHGARDVDDVNEDGTTEPYSIALDAAGYPLSDVWEWIKYEFRRGNSATANADGRQAQFYIGSQLQVSTGAPAGGSFTEGATLYFIDTNNSSGLGTNAVIAKAVLVAAHGTTNSYILRELRTYASLSHADEVWNAQASPTVTATISSYNTITPVKASPLGSYAGGKLFAAQGVVLLNYAADDINNFQLIDDGGNVVTAPIKVAITIGNTRAADRVAVYRLNAAGGSILKNEYAGTAQLAGATTVVVGSAIAVDVPGKTSGGVLFVGDVSANEEYRIRFASWSGSTFTLASQTGLAADTGSTATVLVDAAATFITWGIKVGDLVRNVTEGVVTYVVSVDSETQLTTTPVTDWTGDSYEINTLPVDTTTSDYVYVPLIHAHETTGTDASPGSESVNITYSADIPVRVVARHAGAILPYVADGTVTSSGFSNNIIRTADTIYTAP